MPLWCVFDVACGPVDQWGCRCAGQMVERWYPGRWNSAGPETQKLQEGGPQGNWAIWLMHSGMQRGRDVIYGIEQWKWAPRCLTHTAAALARSQALMWFLRHFFFYVLHFLGTFSLNTGWNKDGGGKVIVYCLFMYLFTYINHTYSEIGLNAF